MPANTCVNPLEYFVQYAENYIAFHPGATFASVLDQFNIFQNNLGICCPCNNYYYLGGTAVQATDYYVTVNPDPDNQCCINAASTVEPIVNFQGIAGSSYQRCCNGFSECLSDIIKDYPADIVMTMLGFNIDGLPGQNDYGIFEIGSFTDGSLLCVISKWICEKGITKAVEYFNAILQKGLVIHCTPAGVFIGSYQTFLDNYIP